MNEAGKPGLCAARPALGGLSSSRTGIMPPAVNLARAMGIPSICAAAGTIRGIRAADAPAFDI
ncbi:hypothetical protein [Burkholderia ubonensis]|uniref:hypothetical protein n=1 Tax=Burkholderia ubonensis TaxID=101571 RepID=UPI000A512F9B|nr:hypothetical protein [Burkholderia ubonensis]